MTPRASLNQPDAVPSMTHLTAKVSFSEPPVLPLLSTQTPLSPDLHANHPALGLPLPTLSLADMPLLSTVNGSPTLLQADSPLPSTTNGLPCPATPLNATAATYKTPHIPSPMFPGAGTSTLRMAFFIMQVEIL